MKISRRNFFKVLGIAAVAPAIAAPIAQPVAAPSAPPIPPTVEKAFASRSSFVDVPLAFVGMNNMTDHTVFVAMGTVDDHHVWVRAGECLELEVPLSGRVGVSSSKGFKLLVADIPGRGQWLTVIPEKKNEN